MKINSDQIGHWYKCKKEGCRGYVPLPDNLFDPDNELISIPAKCESGHANMFKKFEALSPTRKWEVDRYFNARDSRSNIKAYWNGPK